MDKCPYCSTEVFNSKLAKYCICCGKNLTINACRNSKCIINTKKIFLPDYARFCPICGNPTTFSDEVQF